MIDTSFLPPSIRPALPRSGDGGRLFLLLALFTLLLGCAGRGGQGIPESGLSVPATAVLDSLRARTEATESLRAEGTVLVRLKNEKHFLHFQACYRRPDHSRLDVDLEGPLGLGRGRLTIVRRGRNVDLRHPEGEIERTVLGSESLAFLDTYGLSPATVPYLVAPYTGTADLFDEERLVTSGRDGRTGSLRVVLRRDDGLREVLLVDPDRFDLTERRIVEAGGTVRILFRYLYDEGGEGPASILLPREVETRVPAEEADLRARFRKKERNIDISDTAFFVR